MSKPVPPQRKLLLIGWGGADWQLVTPLLESGQLPNLQSLIERGVMGSLASLLPLDSASLWTSIATGKRPATHGVVRGVEIDPALGILQPTSRFARRTPAFWNILDHHGIAGDVINWPASHPAEAIAGTVVSDAYSRAVGRIDEPWPIEHGTILPSSMATVLRDLRVHPSEIEGDQLLSFIPRLASIDQRSDRRVALLAQVLAQTASVHAATTWLLQYGRWQFAAVRYEGLDRLTQGFLRYQEPQLPYVDGLDCALYGEVVPAAYRFYDMMLGRLVDLAGEDATILLVSDHGFRTGAARPPDPAAPPSAWHRSQGIICLAGPDIRQDELLHQASVLDIAPTILTLFELPIGADMEGHPLLSAWQRAPTAEIVPSHDSCFTTAEPSDRPPAPCEDEDALVELRALGYVDTALPALTRLAASKQQSNAYSLAVSELHAGQHAPARALLDQILRDDPTLVPARLLAAYSSLCLGESGRAREYLAGFAHEADACRERALLTAMVLIEERRAVEALQALERARDHGEQDPLVTCLIGRAYLTLDRHAEAEEMFQRVRVRDGDSLGAALGLTLVSFHRQRWEEVVDRALTVVRLDHYQSAVHYMLGVALVHLDRAEWAVQAFETAAATRPGWAAPQRWLTQLRGPTVRVRTAEPAVHE
jgi:predicted AlkP superfamily phosphohydrolase/phosphomutase/tetratricopeptide (TPR) repeat protein